MKAGSRSRSGVFLLEFLIVLLIFSLAGAVTVRLFSATAHLREETILTDRAVADALALKASLQASSGTDTELDALFGAPQDDGTRVCCPSSGSDDQPALAAHTILSISDQAGGRLVEGTLDIMEDGSASESPLYTLSFAVFFPAENKPGREVKP